MLSGRRSSTAARPSDERLRTFKKDVSPTLGQAVAEALRPANEGEEPLQFIGRHLLQKAGITGLDEFLGKKAPLLPLPDAPLNKKIDELEEQCKELRLQLEVAEKNVKSAKQEAERATNKLGQHEAPEQSVATLQDMKDRVAKRALEAAMKVQEEKKKKKRDDEPHWEAHTWLEGEGLATKLGQLLLATLERHKALKDADASLDHSLVPLELIRSLHTEEELGKGKRKEAVLSLLQESDCLEELADFLDQKMHKLLKVQKAVSGDQLNTKFVEEYQDFEMTFGQRKDFFAGLDGLIGPPNPNLLEGMRWEHCESKDSEKLFTTSNSNIETTSLAEFLVVFEPDLLEHHISGSPPSPLGKRLILPSDLKPGKQKSEKKENVNFIRMLHSPVFFTAKLFAKNEQLAELDIAGLSHEEFCAARLYTGPMFMKYNTVLRGKPDSASAYLKNKLEKFCGDNRYVTTLHCINSAIVKLGRLSKCDKVYRGLSGSVLPRQFWKDHGSERGGVEFAFMSTTADREVAMQYASGKKNHGSTIIEIQMGMIDRGADLSWLSQYPHEKETTFAPFTGLEIVNTRVEETVLVVEMRLNVNLLSPTIEKAVAKMRNAHVQLLQLTYTNLRAADVPKRVLLSMRGLLSADKGREAEWFNKMDNFRSATQMALETQHGAFVVLKDKQLWEQEEKRMASEAEQELKTARKAAVLSFAGKEEKKEAELTRKTAVEKAELAADPTHIEKVTIPTKMRMSAEVCARAGEHDVALSLLYQAFKRDGSLVTLTHARTDVRGRLLQQRASTESSIGALELKGFYHPLEIKEEDEWRLELAYHMVQKDIPAPWPATLCRLTRAHHDGEYASDAQRASDLQSAIIKVIVGALRSKAEGVDEEDKHLEELTGLLGLTRETKLLVSVSSVVAETKQESWRKANVGKVREGWLLQAAAADAKEQVKVKVNEPQEITEDGPDKGKKRPPTVTLPSVGTTYAVEWTSDEDSGEGPWPPPGEYQVVRHIPPPHSKAPEASASAPHPHGKAMLKRAGTVNMTISRIQHLRETIEIRKAGKNDGPVWHFKNVYEGFLEVETREGKKKREYSKAQIAMGQVLMMPRDNLKVSSGPGALLREAAATGNTELIEALLGMKIDVITPPGLEGGESESMMPVVASTRIVPTGEAPLVSPFEADNKATMAVHLAAEEGHADAFRLLWKVSREGDELAAPAMAFLLRNRRGKRALDFIFEGGHANLARITRPDASDIECDKVAKEKPDALQWPERVLLLHDKILDDEEKKTMRAGEAGIGAGSSSPRKPRSPHQPRRKTAFGIREDRLLTCDTETLVELAKEKEMLVELAKEEERTTGMTPLMLACRLPASFQAIFAVAALLRGKADPTKKTKMGCTALSMAAEMGHPDVCQLLLKAKAEVDARLEDGKTPLMLACKNGHVETTQILLEAGADESLKESSEADGFTAIMHAALLNKTECVEAIISHHSKEPADLMSKMSKGLGGAAAAMVGASTAGMMGLEVHVTADVNKDDFTPLMLAALHGQRQVVQQLLRETTVEVNAKNIKGETALDLAAKNGHAQVVCALLTGGADVDTVDNLGYTALHHCCITPGGDDVADALLEVGADIGFEVSKKGTPWIDIEANDKSTALHFACMAGNYKMVDALLKRKADVSIRNQAGKVPYMMAAAAGHDAVMEKLQPVRTHLQSHSAKINTLDLFRDARDFVRDYGLQRLKHELVAPGFVERKTGDLTTTFSPLNVFAAIGAQGKEAGILTKATKDKFDKANKCLANLSEEYASKFIIAYNVPDADKHWDQGGKWVGTASMSKRHRFMIIKHQDRRNRTSVDDPDPAEGPMDQGWGWFNALTMGMRDVDPGSEYTDPEDIKKLEDRPELNLKELSRAIANLQEMRVAAYRWVRKAAEGAKDAKDAIVNCPDFGWTQDKSGTPHLEDGTTSGLDEEGTIPGVSLKHVGLYVHCYPHCSVNSLHLHIVDEYHTADAKWSEERNTWVEAENVLESKKPEYSNLGPTFDHCRFKNLHIDCVIEALKQERDKLMASKANTKGSKKVLPIGRAASHGAES